MSKKLTEHFTINEVIFSSTASRMNIDNTIDIETEKDIYNNVLDTLENCIEPIRCHFKIPFNFNSFYRCKELNIAIGGSVTSDHCHGKAADIEIPSVHNIDLGIWCYENLEFKQLIFEFVDKESPTSGWVHISYDKNNNKKQVLQAYKEAGKTKYKELSKEDIYNLKG